MERKKREALDNIGWFLVGVVVGWFSAVGTVWCLLMMGLM